MLSIPLSDIKPWENNKSLRGIRHEGFDRIKKNLELGQHTPLLVYKNENNEYICIGGNHRLLAMRELNYLESDCMLLTFESDENGFYGVINGKVYKDKEGKIGKYYKSIDQGLIEFSFSHNMNSAFYLEDEVFNYVGSLPDIDWSLYNADFEEPIALSELENQAEKDAETIRPEVIFTEELSEAHNYIVLYFDNEIDWLQLQTLYPLKSVKALDSKSGFEKVGIGRVVRGIDFLNSLLKKTE